MHMIVDAALITKKSVGAEFNTDSVNASGKVWPREIVHSEAGIKAAGKSQGRPYYVLASADTKGTAESAADLFKSCLTEFSADGSNASMVISDFFRAFASVLDQSGFTSAACDLCVFFGCESQVYLAKSGKARLFRYTDGAFTEAVPQLFWHTDNEASYGVCSFENVKEDDIFLLVTGKVCANVSDSLLKAICKNSGGDIRKIVALISSNAERNGCTDAISSIAIKIQQSDFSDTSVFAPAIAAQDSAETASVEAEPAEEKSSDADDAEDSSVFAAPVDSDLLLNDSPLNEDLSEVLPPDEETENPFFAEASAFAAAPAPEAAETVEYTDDDEPAAEKERAGLFRLTGGGAKRIAVVNIALIAIILVIAFGLIFAKSILNKRGGKNPVLNTDFTEDETSESLSDEDETTTAAQEEETTAQQEESTTDRVNAPERTTADEIVPATTLRNRTDTSPTRTAANPTEPPVTREPVAEPPTTPVTEPPTEPITEPPTEPITEPPTEPITEPPTEPEETVDHIPDD